MKAKVKAKRNSERKGKVKRWNESKMKQGIRERERKKIEIKRTRN